MSKRSFSVLVASLALGLSACSGASAPEGQRPESGSSTATPASSPASPSASASPLPTSAGAASAAPSSPGGSATATGPASVPASPTDQGAGSEVELTTFYPVDTALAADGKVGVLRSPSGNIGCDIWAAEGRAVCGVISYAEERLYPGEQLPRWVFDLGDGVQEVEIGSRADALFFIVAEDAGQPVQALDYGTSTRYGSLECRSEVEALTCTNSKTGHGVSMSAQGYETF